MPTKKETGIAVPEKNEVAVVDPAALALLKDLYPTEQNGFNRIILPRLSFVSQDQMEGEGKAKKCVVEAGTFFTERQSDEVDENGKKIWKKTEIGTALTGVILYHRYQLSYYDEPKNEYTSSPVYDSQDEVLPLWCSKKEVAKGTPAELKALKDFAYVDEKDGKKKSKLKDNRILYILYQGELFQLNLHGSSMYSFMKYARLVNPPTVMTHFESEPKEKGNVNWNMMTFKMLHLLPSDEIMEMIDRVKEIRMAIELEKGARAEKVEVGIDAEQTYNDM